MFALCEELREFSAFYGVSAKRIAKLLENTDFRIEKYNAGEIINHTNDICEDISFVLSGTIIKRFNNSNNLFYVDAEYGERHCFGHIFIYGMDRTYFYNVKAKTDAEILRIPKSDFIKIIKENEIVMMNYLNVLSYVAQTPADIIRDLRVTTLANVLVMAVKGCTSPDATKITFHVDSIDLANMLGMTVTQVELELQKLVYYKYIKIDQVEKKIHVLNRNDFVKL